MRRCGAQVGKTFSRRPGSGILKLLSFSDSFSEVRFMKSPIPLFGALILTFASPVQAEIPKGWWAAPSEDYKVGVEASEAGKPAAYVEAVAPVPSRFFALNQTLAADDYRSKRVRLKGQIKTKDVDKWAGFWLRADAENKIVAFDNMQRRGVTGTTDWQAAEIVLDIPAEAEKLTFGLILDGKGKAWMRDIKFEVVDASVPVTASARADLPRAPVNLDFTE
jgi:hypothetical protein